jgi:hypothetical protein
VPETILGQLGNRVQHALRAFTPRDQKAVRTAAETFPPNPKLDVVKTITQLGVGEALVTTLQEGGVPLPVERTLIAPPRCRIGTITDAERAEVRMRSPVGTKYDQAVNRESASEMLAARRNQTDDSVPMPQAPSRAPTARAPSEPATPSADPGMGSVIGGKLKDMIFGTSRRQGMIETMAKQTMRTAGSRLGQQILRGVLGSIMKK